jgi:hypothetical protein
MDETITIALFARRRGRTVGGTVGGPSTWDGLPACFFGVALLAAGGVRWRAMLHADLLLLM